jgi:pSer/pThr/pTyr-binding forkhead associated (FHA) protein/tRNA A-37 threonylcarbamoyl transferase component Bud32
MRPKLVILQGAEAGRFITLARGQFRIGRGTGNHLQLGGSLVSRDHALIVFEQGRWVLYDRDSTNGTYVDGRRVARHVLQPGDRFHIGPAVIEFRHPAAASSRSRPSPRTGVSLPSPAPPVPLSIPRLRDYVLTPIKHGGAAQIYKAARRDGRETVAIKVLRNSDPYVRQKFADEARIMAALDHPRIAKAYEYGQVDGAFFFVMDYCGGGTLRDRLVPGRPTGMELVTRVIGQTCDALEYAHRHGVVHRDIKPENIMFTHQDEVKVVDFGIAKLAGQLTQTVDGMIIGTPYYLSYEQARGIPVDPRSDIYSLGVVLYELVTGRVPFQGDALEVVHQHLTEQPAPPRQLNPTLSPAIEHAVLQALQKNRDQRIQTTRDLAVALSCWPDGQTLVQEEREAAPQSAVAAHGGLSSGVTALTIAAGPLRGRRLALPAGRTMLGRANVNPDDVSLSRHHAYIVVQQGTTWLEDMGSRNGSFVNGQRVFGRTLLSQGDDLRLGNTVLNVAG